MGWRLYASLAAALDRAGVTRLAGLVSEVSHTSERVTGVELATGERIDAGALVLATGRAMGGGISRSVPFTEALLDLPLFIEGAPVTRAHHPPDLVTRRLLDDHPLFTVGLGIDHHLHPLNRTARAAWSNLFAAGLVIGGSAFARDGTAFGVSLATGLIAGQNAARAVGATVGTA